jgi:hypothetical protein
MNARLPHLARVCARVSPCGGKSDAEDLDCSTFVLLSPVVRASLSDSVDRAENDRFTYENR